MEIFVYVKSCSSCTFIVLCLMHSVCVDSGTDWVDPLDPTVIAENELLSAANSIEAAAKKLAQLQPRLRPRVHVSYCLLIMLLLCLLPLLA